MSSPLFFAHIRAAIGSAVQQTNCHPFRHGRWLFMHNGFIDGFAAIKRDLMLAVDESLFPEIKGRSDTEVLFYLALTFGLERTIRRMLARAIAVDADRLPATQSSSKMQSGSVAAIRVRAYAYPPSFGAAPGRSLSPGTATHNGNLCLRPITPAGVRSAARTGCVAVRLSVRVRGSLSCPGQTFARPSGCGRSGSGRRLGQCCCCPDRSGSLVPVPVRVFGAAGPQAAGRVDLVRRCPSVPGCAVGLRPGLGGVVRRRG